MSEVYVIEPRSLEDRFGTEENYYTEQYGHYSISVRMSEGRFYFRWTGDKEYPMEMRTHNEGLAFRMLEILSEEVIRKYADKYPTICDSVPDSLKHLFTRGLKNESTNIR